MAVSKNLQLLSHLQIFAWWDVFIWVAKLLSVFFFACWLRLGVGLGVSQCVWLDMAVQVVPGRASLCLAVPSCAWLCLVVTASLCLAVPPRCGWLCLGVRPEI